MQRILLVKAGFIANIVAYADGLVVDAVIEGCDTATAVTGAESVGDAFDITDALRERRINQMDTMIYKELFRLTNEVRVLRSLATITAAQYRTAIKAQG